MSKLCGLSVVPRRFAERDSSTGVQRLAVTSRSLVVRLSTRARVVMVSEWV